MTSIPLLLLLLLQLIAVSFILSNAYILQPRPVTSNPQRKLSLEAKSSSLYAKDSTKVDETYYDLSLFSPCKINLFLRILNKREDGYHNLASLFQTVGFGDMLYLKLLDSNAEDDIFDCNMAGVPKDKGNLVLKAIDLMRKKLGVTDKFFEVNLIKQVPAQAGLGGGSGNAATALFGVNELLGRPATEEQLIEWSGELGSDITFFLSKGTAYCTGRGEILEPILPPFPTNPSSNQKVCIIKPNKIGLSTPSVFKALNYEKLSTLDPRDYLLQRFLECEKGNGSVEDVEKGVFMNDLEEPAFSVVPLLRTIKEDLIECGFTHVLMSGSGTSIFAIGGIDEDTGYPLKDPDAFKEKFIENDVVNVYFTEFINRGDGEWYKP